MRRPGTEGRAGTGAPGGPSGAPCLVVIGVASASLLATAGRSWCPLAASGMAEMAVLRCSRPMPAQDGSCHSVKDPFLQAEVNC